MEKNAILATLEAVLFAMGASVEVSKLAEVIECDIEETKKYIYELKEKFDSAEHGITIIELEDSFQLVTKPEMYDALVKIAKTPQRMSLSDSVIETLSSIAYKQPITRLEIENVRGVNCDYALNKLIEYNLVCELGRKDAPGRPLLFGTTEEFLRSFGVKSLSDLPEIDNLKVEEFKQEAEEEVQMSLKL